MLGNVRCGFVSLDKTKKRDDIVRRYHTPALNISAIIQELELDTEQRHHQKVLLLRH